MTQNRNGIFFRVLFLFGSQFAPLKITHTIKMEIKSNFNGEMSWNVINLPSRRVRVCGCLNDVPCGWHERTSFRVVWVRTSLFFLEKKTSLSNWIIVGKIHLALMCFFLSLLIFNVANCVNCAHQSIYVWIQNFFPSSFSSTLWWYKNHHANLRSSKFFSWKLIEYLCDGDTDYFFSHLFESFL